MSGQVSLFDSMGVDEVVLERPLPRATPASSRERLRWEKELLGLYLSDHPLGELAADMGRYVNAYSGDMGEELDQQRVVIGGVVTGVRRVITKARATMAVATIEDVQGSLEVVVFPKVLEETAALWPDDAVLLVAGRVDHKGEETVLLADAVWTWEDVGRWGRRGSRGRWRRGPAATRRARSRLVGRPDGGGSGGARTATGRRDRRRRRERRRPERANGNGNGYGGTRRWPGTRRAAPGRGADGGPGAPPPVPVPVGAPSDRAHGGARLAASRAAAAWACSRSPSRAATRRDPRPAVPWPPVAGACPPGRSPPVAEPPPPSRSGRSRRTAPTSRPGRTRRAPP